MLIKEGARLLDAAAVKRVHSGKSLFLRSVAGIAVLLGLAVGASWLLMNVTRSANIPTMLGFLATILGLLAAILDLLVSVWTALREMSLTESSPETGNAPRKQNWAAFGRVGRIVVALTVICGALLTITLVRPFQDSMSTTSAGTSSPTTPPVIPSTTPTVTAIPAAPLPSQIAAPVVVVPGSPQPAPARTNPSQPAVNPPADPGFGDRRPMDPPHHPPMGPPRYPQPPPEQTDFGPAGTGLSCSPFTPAAIRIRAIAATDGRPGIATHNFIDLDVLRPNRPGYTYWIIAHLFGTNGDSGPYFAKQQVRSSVGLENDPLQLDADINSVREIYIVEADSDGTEKLKQNNQLPMDGSQDNQPVRVNPPPGQTVSATCRVTKTRD